MIKLPSICELWALDETRFNCESFINTHSRESWFACILLPHNYTNIHYNRQVNYNTRFPTTLTNCQIPFPLSRLMALLIDLLNIWNKKFCNWDQSTCKPSHCACSFSSFSGAIYHPALLICLGTRNAILNSLDYVVWLYWARGCELGSEFGELYVFACLRPVNYWLTPCWPTICGQCWWLVKCNRWSQRIKAKPGLNQARGTLRH